MPISIAGHIVSKNRSFITIFEMIWMVLQPNLWWIHVKKARRLCRDLERINAGSGTILQIISSLQLLARVMWCCIYNLFINYVDRMDLLSSSNLSTEKEGTDIHFHLCAWNQHSELFHFIQLNDYLTGWEEDEFLGVEIESCWHAGKPSPGNFLQIKRRRGTTRAAMVMIMVAQWLFTSFLHTRMTIA